MRGCSSMHLVAAFAAAPATTAAAATVSTVSTKWMRCMLTAGQLPLSSTAAAAADWAGTTRTHSKLCSQGLMSGLRLSSLLPFALSRQALSHTHTSSYCLSTTVVQSLAVLLPCAAVRQPDLCCCVKHPARCCCVGPAGDPVVGEATRASTQICVCGHARAD